MTFDGGMKRARSSGIGHTTGDAPPAASEAGSTGPWTAVVGLGGSGMPDACKGVAVDADCCAWICNGVVWAQLSSTASDRMIESAMIDLAESLRDEPGAVSALPNKAFAPHEARVG